MVVRGWVGLYLVDGVVEVQWVFQWCEPVNLTPGPTFSPSHTAPTPNNNITWRVYIVYNCMQSISISCLPPGRDKTQIQLLWARSSWWSSLVGRWSLNWCHNDAALVLTLWIASNICKSPIDIKLSHCHWHQEQSNCRPWSPASATDSRRWSHLSHVTISSTCDQW